MRDRLVAEACPQQQRGQMHAEREVVWKRCYSVPQARDHGMLVFHAPPGVSAQRDLDEFMPF
jgi:hypothetical protein